MKSIIAKLRCDMVDNRNKGVETVHLNAVTDGSEENKSFAAATPAAHVELTISNPDAIGAFKQGAEYLVRFDEAAPAGRTTETLAEAEQRGHAAADESTAE